MIPEQVRTWCREHGWGDIVSMQPIGGGCINHGVRIKTASGQTFFLKVNDHTPVDMFEREAEGLKELRVEGGPRVPIPYCYGPNFLLLEDLAPAPRRNDFWPDLGRRLARLHLCVRSQFGFHHDNYIGSTPQPNPWMEDGYRFFAEHRLLFQTRLARERGLLGRGEVQRLEKLATRLPDLVPHQPASLIHGDLWSGNVITDAEGAPAIIDPAAHYGWAEAELAMTALFGAFPEAFYKAYEEVRPLIDGYRQRFPIYNLYHLLNHLNLFGAGYLSEVLAIVRQYA